MSQLGRLICLCDRRAVCWPPDLGAAGADSTGPVPAAPSRPPGRALRRGGVQPRPPPARDQGVGARRRPRSGRATELRQSFPEAWNELGYALRHVGRYPDSVAAYEQALRPPAGLSRGPRVPG